MCLAQSGRAGRNGLALNKQTTPPGSYLHRPSAKRNGPSFDHLVGAGEHRIRGSAKRRTGFRLCRRVIDSALFSSLVSGRVFRLTSAGPVARHQPGCSSRSARLHSLVPRTDSSFVIFALKRIIKYLVDSWVQGIVRMAVIADINRDRNAAMNVTFVAPLPKSDVSLVSGDVT